MNLNRAVRQPFLRLRRRALGESTAPCPAVVKPHRVARLHPMPRGQRDARRAPTVQAAWRWAALLLWTVGLPVASAAADDFSWNSGNGSFYQANNWNPHGLPGLGDTVRIGDLVGVQGSTVTLGGGNALLSLQSLEISSAMTLDGLNTQVFVDGQAHLIGNNSRIVVRQANAGPNPYHFDADLRIGQGAHFQLMDLATARLRAGSRNDGLISGRGSIFKANLAAFNNNGTIRPGNNGGIVLTQGGLSGLINLDGTAETGHLDLINIGAVLQVNATGLTDSFSGTITMAPLSLLTMNLNNGWTADAAATVNVAGFGNINNAAQINGSAWDFGGTLNIGGNQGHLRLLAETTFQPTAQVNIGHTDRLTIEGAATVEGGGFMLDQGANLIFNGATTMQGGQFATVSNQLADGFVSFNGPTTWAGSVTLNGAARQNGDAIVSGSGSRTIQAGLFDMDGASGQTSWNIHSNLIVNADQIGTTAANRFDGSMQVSGGFTPRLTVNLSDPAASWTMGGEMNLSGVAAAAFYVDRVAGSLMRVEGDMTVDHRVRISADAVFANGSHLHFATPASALQMMGGTYWEAGTQFSGGGLLHNGVFGEMVLRDGLMMGTTGLVNSGEWMIEGRPGTISTHSFENQSTGTWTVQIGGPIAGLEHDLLIVGGGAALLDGHLNVELYDMGWGTFLPEVGDTFTILASLGGVSGAFLNNPVTHAAGQQFHWSVIYNPHDVQLQLSAIGVPEPSLIVLLGGLAMMGCFWRRRRAPAVAARQPSPRAPARSWRWARAGVACGIATALCWASESSARAQNKFWIGGSGHWGDANNWSPLGVPGAGHSVWMMNDPLAPHRTTWMNQAVSVNHLTLSGPTLLQSSTDCCGTGVIGHQLTVAGTTSIWEGARLVMYNAGPGVDFQTNHLLISGTNSSVGLYGSQIRVNEVLQMGVGARLAGPGSVDLMGAGTTFINDGTLSQGPGFMQLRQFNGGTFDLDGITNNGIIRVGSSIEEAAILSILNGAMTDSFSGEIDLGPNSYLNMEVGPWVADVHSRLRAFDWGQSLSRLNGDQVTLAGSVEFANAWHGSEFRILADAILAPTVEFSMNDHGLTTFHHTTSTVVQGGQFTIGEQAQLDFNGATTVLGGTFHTAGDQLTDGFVAFNGPTTWNGSVTIQGAARQMGTATISGPTTLTGDRLDLSGAGATTWNVNSGAVLNLGQIHSSNAQVFTGTLNVGGGFLGRWTLNLDDPNASWTMAGTMNLNGLAVAAFPIDRLSGSHVEVAGDMNIAHRVRVSADATFVGGSTVNLDAADALVQFTGATRFESGTSFLGHGTIENGISGEMVLNNGVVFNELGFTNRGSFAIDDGAGIATVHRFENVDSGTWHVQIGGLLAGVEHDRLLVSGGPTLLDGHLDVELIDLGFGTFLPEIGDQFTILFSLGNISGEFLADPVSQVGGQLFHWSALYHPHDVTLQLVAITSAVPEPGVGGCLLAACLFVAGVRRGKRERQ